MSEDEQPRGTPDIGVVPQPLGGAGPAGGPAGPAQMNDQVRAFYKAFNDVPPPAMEDAFRKHHKALLRVLAREDIADVQVMPDGTFRCVDLKGNVTQRAAGWRPRG